jgi:alpha-D-xyloside xylohydrolase
MSLPEKRGPFTKHPNRLQWEDEGELFWIDPYGPNTLRFRSSRSLRIVDQDWTLLPQPEAQLDIQIDKEQATVTNGTIRAEIRAWDGRVKYLNEQGDILLWESFHHHVPRFARRYRSRGSDHFELTLTFDAEKTEHLYGMGQYPNDCLDLKGTVLELAQKNTQISIPFLLSSKGYGFIWNNPSVGRAELSKTHTSFTARYARQIDYLIFPGHTPAEIVGRYADLTGKSPMMPGFAAGFWQSKLRYASQEELLSVAREYKRRNLPLSVIVADFYHWSRSGDWKFDPEFWPNPQAMVEELESMGVKLLVSVWPTANRESENYEALRKQNFLIHPEVGVNIFLAYKDMLTFVDVTHPGARHFLWSKIKQNYHDLGVRIFWLDEAEPEIDPLDYENVRYYAGNGLEVSNLYPYHFAQALYEGQTESGQTEIINQIRSGWIGIQRFGVALWSGDIYGNFDTLRRQVKAGLNLALCGIPWWSSDIGGFFWDAETPEQFPELLIRWFQYGAFCPIMRLHGNRPPFTEIEGSLMGTGSANEVWSFGEEAYRIMVHYLKVRERLRPYLLEQMARASKDGTPVMRPLFYDYPQDEECYLVEDQYLFGPDLLVAPVLEYRAESRQVHLPAGATWTDALSGRVIVGGQTVTVPVSLDHIPLFCRDGFDFSLR